MRDDDAEPDVNISGGSAGGGVAASFDPDTAGTRAEAVVDRLGELYWQKAYGGNDYDGFQFVPDVPDDEMVELGTTVRVVIRFLQEQWNEVHSKHITVGMPFEIREGARTVGRGTVTKL